MNLVMSMSDNDDDDVDATATSASSSPPPTVVVVVGVAVAGKTQNFTVNSHFFLLHTILDSVLGSERNILMCPRLVRGVIRSDPCRSATIRDDGCDSFVVVVVIDVDI